MTWPRYLQIMLPMPCQQDYVISAVCWLNKCVFVTGAHNNPNIPSSIVGVGPMVKMINKIWITIAGLVLHIHICLRTEQGGKIMSTANKICYIGLHDRK